jgi:hypothetical protein
MIIDYSALYKRHYRGAWARSLAAVIMSVIILPSFMVGLITADQMIGVIGSVLFLILFNPPTLWLLRRLRSKRPIKVLSLTINLLEVFGYTAVIYFHGGVEGMFLLPIYGILIAYVGMAAPRGYAFIVATYCAVLFSLMVIAEIFGWLPHQTPGRVFFFTVQEQWVVLAVVIGLLYVSAFLADYNASLLKKNRDAIRRQKDELEIKVAERTTDLHAANRQLEQELERRRRAEDMLRISRRSEYRSERAN